MNTPNVERAVDAALSDLSAMPDEEFDRLFKEHMHRQVVELMIKAGLLFGYYIPEPLTWSFRDAIKLGPFS